MYSTHHPLCGTIIQIRDHQTTNIITAPPSPYFSNSPRPALLPLALSQQHAIVAFAIPAAATHFHHSIEKRNKEASTMKRSLIAWPNQICPPFSCLSYLCLGFLAWSGLNSSGLQVQRFRASLNSSLIFLRAQKGRQMAEFNVLLAPAGKTRR